MKKQPVIVAVLCLALVLSMGCAAAVQNQMPEIAQVTRGDLVIGISVNGNLEMPHKTDLSFGTTGVVQQVLVEEGDEIVEGQVLAQLDARALEFNVASAEAAYRMAQINLMKTIYPAYTKTWGTDLPGVWLALREAKEHVKEVEELLREGEVEEAYVLLDMIEKNLSKAEEKSLATRWELPWDVRLLELQVDQARASLDAAKLNLEKAQIVAPFDAVVADITVSEGKELSSMTYGNPAISLVDTSKIEMKGYIDEIDIAMVDLGHEAGVVVDALPDKDVRGRVTFISQIGTVQSGVVFYDTTISLVSPDTELRDGMSATAEIILQSRENVLLIPNRAIRGSLDHPVVAVAMTETIRSKDDVEARPVTLGLSDGIYTEVLSGLQEGDRVVLPAEKNSSGPFHP